MNGLTQYRACGQPTLFFIRHGLTDWNLEGRLQGQRDIPLNDTGREQARRNGAMLKELLAALVAEISEPLQFIASPLGRTRETMEIVRATLGLPPEDYANDARLIEISWGAWEGLTWKELKQRDRPAYDARYADKFGTRAPSGESYADVTLRVADWLKEIRQPTVVVSHGGVNRCLQGVLRDLAPRSIVNLHVPQNKVMLFDGKTTTWH